METIYFFIGLILGSLIAYFLLKSNFVSKSSNYDLKHQLNLKEFELSTMKNNYSELEKNWNVEKEKIEQYIDQLEDFKTEYSKIEKKNVELEAEINLQKSLYLKQEDHLKELQSQAKSQFENLASKILEEKTEKFTLQNSNQLKQILEPFQNKIQELKNQVHETYDKESKERFSLEAKVKELAQLNLQISEEAKRLTNALKGESKTQGNWGEMILESILEKSGLTKGQEYFLEYQLKDEDNKALYSEFSGKKMRPDAIIKYPDNRTVIIDSKVSLTAFSEINDDNDAETNQIIINRHLTSIKNHILELSRKAYDDYPQSLDFIMMFIPSEAAYIMAMQHDQNLWNYAYEKRILLLNPSNLITSLKLINELWKRDYQNKNAIEIANRGAKLYDKFVGFIENLERIGKNIDNAKSAYQDAFKQLAHGKDNLINQTQKLHELGAKGKKELPSSLIENSNQQ